MITPIELSGQRYGLHYRLVNETDAEFIVGLRTDNKLKRFISSTERSIERQIEWTKEYKEKVTETKKGWLNRYNFPYDKIHAVKYGTTKANCTRGLGGFQILVDDNEKVRKGWHLGDTIDANENIIEKLVDIIEKEYYNR